MRYLIIGNSAAAVGAVEGIRQLDTTGEIAIVSDEVHHTYSRPLISYLLQGKTDKNRMKYRGDNFYQDNGCKTYFGKKVTGILAGDKKVVLDDGEELIYDKLLVATGSRAFVPPFEGLGCLSENQLHTFMTLDDADRLSEQLSGLDKSKKVLVVGAGLIGLKCAEGIADKAASVTVVDLAPRILSSILDEEGARIVQRHIESKGIVFRLSESVKRFEKNAAWLDEEGKSKIPFDIVVIAVGVRPNIELVKDIVQTERGIIVDENSMTSYPDIYAAGDCTQTMDVSSGQSKIMALLPNAYMQGETAGISMAGGAKSFDKAIPMNAIGFWGMHMITAGSYFSNDGNEEREVYTEKGEAAYKQLFYDQERLYGYIMIGDVMKAGIYTALIREQTPLSSIDFELVRKSPGLMAFNREDRMVKLGGFKK